MSQTMPEPKYIIDSDGTKTAVVLDIKQYKKLLRMIEEAEDAEYVKSVRREPTRDYHQYRKHKL